MIDVDDIVTTALKRAAILLNQTYVGTRKRKQLLTLLDSKLRDNFADDPNIFVYNKVKQDISVSQPEALKKYFYGDLRIDESHEGIIKLVYSPTEAFLDLLISNIEVQTTTSPDLKFPASISTRDVLFNCATNYLLKNIWHNFYHNYFQNIHLHSYKNFKGYPRTISEFSADNMANIYLVLSYGEGISYDGFQESENISNIQAIFHRNRSNKLFRERSDILDEGIEPYDKYLRNICNYVSCLLVRSGYSVASLIPFANEGGEVVMQLNGYFIPTKIDAKIHLETKSYHQRESHYKEVAYAVKAEYSWLLKHDYRMKEEAKIYLGILLHPLCGFAQINLRNLLNGTYGT